MITKRSMGKNTKLLTITLMLGACASVHLGSEQSYLPAHLSAEPSMATGAGDLHVITWNLHGSPDTAPMDDRLARISHELLTRHPDLIVLQEIWFVGDRKVLETALHSEYELIPDDPAIDSGFWNAVIGFRHGGLLAFLRRDGKWKVTSGDKEPFSTFHAFSVAAPASRIHEGDGFAHKGFQRFELAKNGSRVTIFNTHLQSQYGDGRRYVAVREQQIAELTRAANEALLQAPSSITQLVFGDFNTTPAEYGIQQEIMEAWVDLTISKRTGCNCEGTSLDFDEDPKTGQLQTVEADWIDYALARRGTQVAVVDIARILSDKINWPFSDHHGLDVILTLPR